MSDPAKKVEETIPTPPAVASIPPEVEEQVTDEMATKLANKVIQKARKQAIAMLAAEETAISPEVENLMEGHKVPDEEKVNLRKMLDGLPTEAQHVWFRTYMDAKAYALTQDDLKTRASEYAGRTAWASVKNRYQKQGDAWQPKKNSISFDAATGKWTVDHKHFLLPVVVASKDDAVTLLRIVADARQPEVVANEGKYSVSHPDWAEPVVANSRDEATDIVTRKLVDEGWSETDASTAASGLVDAQQKEKIMGSIEVKADTKQIPQKGTVSGIQTDEGASSPKNQQPTVGGKVVVEKPAAEVPTTTCHEGQTKTDNTGAVARMDKLVNQLKTHRGLMKMASDFASTPEKAEALEKFIVEYKPEEKPAEAPAEVAAAPESK